jgi:hypothetical protein
MLDTIHEIMLHNPITREGIDAALSTVRQDTSPYLLLNTGQHQFRSLADLTYVREALEAHATWLSRPTKIALIHPVNFSHISTNPAHYRYFPHRDEAIAWLTT